MGIDQRVSDWVMTPVQGRLITEPLAGEHFVTLE